jgi:hypothetical protein
LNARGKLVELIGETAQLHFGHVVARSGGKLPQKGCVITIPSGAFFLAIEHGHRPLPREHRAN